MRLDVGIHAVQPAGGLSASREVEILPRMNTLVRFSICIVIALVTVAIAIVIERWLMGRTSQAITSVAGTAMFFATWYATRSLAISAPAWLRLPRSGSLPSLTLPAAIIFAAAIMSLTATLLARWEMQFRLPNVVRLDRWTGTIAICQVGDNTPVMRCDAPRLLSDREVFGSKKLDASGLKPFGDDDWVVSPQKK
jgi:hypothetical protein